MATVVGRAEARVRQLCCLGLPSEAVVPALLRDLRSLIPFYGATFFWANKTGALSNIYDEHPEAPRIAELYVKEFYNRREREIADDFQQYMHKWSGVQSTEEAFSVGLERFYASDHYNLLLRPLGYHSFLRLIVRDQVENIGLGGPMLFRSPGERQFSAKEKGWLAALQIFFAHLLVSPSEHDFEVIDSNRSGLIIADINGRPIYSSPEGRRLLFLATNPHTRPGVAASRLSSLPSPLLRLCKNFLGVFVSDATAEAPVYHHRNIWGGFTFTAHWLQGADNGGLIGIVVRHQEPLVVKMVHGLEHLPLSRRQSQVCLLLARGSQYAEIATQLGISKHTAISHGRWVYEKLDVHNRTELVNKLLSLSSGNPRH